MTLNDPDTQQLTTLIAQQLPMGLILVFFQQWIKRSRWFPWITHETTQLNHALSIVLAGLATIGIHESHTGSILAGGTITITLPALSVVLSGIWHWVQQYAITKGLYTTMAPQINPAVPQSDTAPKP